MAKNHESQEQVFAYALEWRLFDCIAILRQLPLNELRDLMVACNLVEPLVWREIHKREMVEAEPFPEEVNE